MELNLQAYLDYNKTFGKHTVGALLGYSQIYKQTRSCNYYKNQNTYQFGYEISFWRTLTGQVSYISRNRIRLTWVFRPMELFIR